MGEISNKLRASDLRWTTCSSPSRGSTNTVRYRKRATETVISSGSYEPVDSKALLFSWSDYFESVRSKMSKKIGVNLRRISHASPLVQELLFNGFVLPLFDYGGIIWDDRENASLMSELQVLQNTDASLILDLPAHSSATEELKRLG